MRVEFRFRGAFGFQVRLNLTSCLVSRRAVCNPKVLQLALTNFEEEQSQLSCFRTNEDNNRKYIIMIVASTFKLFSALLSILLINTTPGLTVNALDTTTATTATTTHDSPSPRGDSYLRGDSFLRAEEDRNLAKCDQCNSCACDDNCDCIGSGSGNKCDQCNFCQCDDNCDCIANKCDQCNSCQCDDNCDCIAPTTPIVGCDPNGGSCRCGAGGDGSVITLNRFWGDSSDEQVWGCGGAFQLSGASLSGQWGGSQDGNAINAGFDFSQSASYHGWEGCCNICGMNLQLAGRLSSGWYCEKDFFSTGIWLKGIN
jgi:hypothetical protein